MAKDKSLFIQNPIEPGHYAPTSDADLSLLEVEVNLKLLRQALIKGEESGWVENFNPIDFKDKLVKRNSVNK